VNVTIVAKATIGFTIFFSKYFLFFMFTWFYVRLNFTVLIKSSNKLIESKNINKNAAISMKYRHLGICRPRRSRLIRGAKAQMFCEFVRQMVLVFVVEQSRSFLDARTILQEFAGQ
jgi:hypothetical protein